MEATQNRIILTVKETALDKTVTVPLNMSKPNKTRIDNTPPTPPSDEEKRSVSFDPSVKTLSIPKDLSYISGLANSPAESLDISVRDCSEEMFVSLKERDTEMKELVICNKEFFDTVKQSIFKDESWEGFLKVLYSKREDVPDCKWMESISKYLSDNPQLLANFKQITGYYESDNDSDVSDDLIYDNEDNDHGYTSELCMMDDGVGYVDIAPIRNYPHVLENLEKSYPQLFINAKEELGKLGKERSRRGSTLGRNHLSNDNPLLHPNVEDQSPSDSSVTLYDEFKRILVIPRDAMDDVEWETAINEILDVSQTLIAHFYEIIIQEINQNIEV